MNWYKCQSIFVFIYSFFKIVVECASALLGPENIGRSPWSMISCEQPPSWWWSCKSRYALRGFACDEQKRFDIQPSEQTLLYKGVELKNMQSVMDCGIQQSETLEVVPTSHLVSITIHFGKFSIPLELKPTSTILGIKMLLKTVNIACFAKH